MLPKLDLVLAGAGWATLEISGSGLSRQIRNISYLSNALDDLLRMGIDIATDKHWTFAEFDHEPATTVLVAETAWWANNDWVNGARLSAVEGNKISASSLTWTALQKAERAFELHVASRDQLAAMFLAAGQRLLEEHGEEGYLEAWGGQLGFPIRALKALEAALACPSNRPNYYG